MILFLLITLVVKQKDNQMVYFIHAVKGDEVCVIRGLFQFSNPKKTFE